MLNIEIENLRSIKKQIIQIAPITLLYGPNGSGKSTIMHSLAILKNIVLNPNQTTDSFFNLGFSNFGGFEQIVFNHSVEEQIKLGINCEYNSIQVFYRISLSKKNGRFGLIILPWNITLDLEITFPYPTNQQETVDIEGFSITWNGILAQVKSIPTQHITSCSSQELATLLNAHIEIIRKTDFVHLKRGFSKPHYGIVSLAPPVFTEDEVATLLANEPYLEGEVSHYLEQILQKDLRVKMTPGTNLFWLNTLDKTTGLTTELVNDGFGINQVVYLLAKCLYRDTAVVCIEEPEIHLHPKALRNLAYALIRMTKDLKKTIIISTHSEHFVLALLSAVAKKELEPNNLSCYLCTKDNRESKFEYQGINDNGQIEGGLTSFMEGELEDLKDILGVK
ncbi:MAG: ATP-binding protein [bacterium]